MVRIRTGVMAHCQVPQWVGVSVCAPRVCYNSRLVALRSAVAAPKLWLGQ